MQLTILITMHRHPKVGPEDLSRKLNISLQKDMLEVTTQHRVQMAVIACQGD
jgi:hypothetical protein